MESKVEEEKLPRNMKCFLLPSRDEMWRITLNARRKEHNLKLLNFANTELQNLIDRMMKAAMNGQKYISLTEDEDEFMQMYSRIFFHSYVYKRGCIDWSNNKHSVVTVPELYMYTPETEDNPHKQKTLICKLGMGQPYECIRQDGEEKNFKTLEDFYNSDW